MQRNGADLDVTKPVDVDVEFLGFYTGMDGPRRAGFSAKAKVNRKDWGLNWSVALEAGGLLVGDQIKLEVEVALQQAVALAAWADQPPASSKRPDPSGRLLCSGRRESVDRPAGQVDDVELAVLVLAE